MLQVVTAPRRPVTWLTSARCCVTFRVQHNGGRLAQDERPHVQRRWLWVKGCDWLVSQHQQPSRVVVRETMRFWGAEGKRVTSRGGAHTHRHTSLLLLHSFG